MTTCSGKPHPFFGRFGVHYWSYDGSENGKLHTGSPKGNYKENCLGWHKSTTLVENLMLFGNFEVHCWSYEDSENCKLHKVRPKGNYKEKCLGWHKMKTFSGKPNH
jgi:hypothetical protein